LSRDWEVENIEEVTLYITSSLTVMTHFLTPLQEPGILGQFDTASHLV
jgi:hypothetical protein